MREDRTLDDLTDEEIAYLEANDPERLEVINDNTNEMMLSIMFPDGMDEE